MITDVFDAITAHPELAGIDCNLGAEFLAENAMPPRIVWVPTTDTFEPGQRTNKPGNGTLISERLQKNVGTRWAGVRIRVWAQSSSDPKTAKADINACEDLLRRLLVAVHELAFGSYRVNGLSWVDADGAELVQVGRACDVSLAFAVPIFKSPDTTATLANINTSGMTGSLGLPSGDVTSTPSP